MIVRNGLGDREDVVKSAAAAVLGAWVDVVGEEQADGREEDVLALLKLFDLTESQVAEDALLSVFTTRVDVFDNLEFGGAFSFSPIGALAFKIWYRGILDRLDA
jgi:condensin complex subunit 3